MPLCRRFSIKIDVISNELLWHSMLRGNSSLKIFPKILPQIFPQFPTNIPANIPTIDFRKIMTLCCSVGDFWLKLMSYQMNRCGTVYILRADAVSYLGNCFVQKKNQCDENQASIKRSYTVV